MNFNQFVYLLSRKKGTLIAIVVLFLLIAVVFSFLMPYKYGAKSKLLVVQNISANGDTYLFLRTNEYLTNLLAQVVLTSSFYNETMNAGFNINKTYFTDDPSEQIKIWKKTVKTSSVGDTGVINITVKHTDKFQASEIIAAIDETLIKKNTLYHSAGDKVEIKLIDQPAVSNKPVEPNILLNIALGLVFGLILGMSYIYAFPDERYNLKLIGSAKQPVVPYTDANQSLMNERMAAMRSFNQPNMQPGQNVYQPQNTGMPARQTNQNFPGDVYHTQTEINGNNNTADDIDNVMKNGSMANIFGQSNQGG